MSTITYKCNVCKREINKVENTEGLTVFSKCIITEGCRGNLYKLFRDPDNIREYFPAPQAGLKDYFPRRFLYEHNQSVTSTEWKIFHNLSVSPTVSVYENSSNGIIELDQDEYTVTILDKDSLSITFERARKGIVHCIAKSSVPVKPQFVTAIADPIRTTSSGMLVFGVPEIITKTESTTKFVPFNTADETIRIEIEVIKPNEEPIICFEDIDDNINSTAWLGWHRILVRNRRHYNLIAKQLDDFRSFTDVQINSQRIPNGTLIKFLRIDYGDDIWQVIPSRGLFLMLSNPPYESADKVRTGLIDLGEMINTEYDYFLYNDGELFTNETNFESTYPDIKEAPGRTPINAIPPTPLISQPIPSASPVASLTPTISVTPSITPTNTVTPTVTPTQTATPTVTPTNTPTNTVTPTNTQTMTVTPNVTATVTPTVTPTITPTITPTNTVTPTQTVTPGPTVTPTQTQTVTPKPTITPTMSVTPTITPTNSG